MKFKLIESFGMSKDIPLEYTDLEFEVSDGNYDWDTGTYGDKMVTQDVQIMIDQSDAVDALLDIIEKKDPELANEINNMDDEAFEAFFTYDKIDDLINKYIDDVLEYFEDRAKEYGSEHYSEY